MNFKILNEKELASVCGGKNIYASLFLEGFKSGAKYGPYGMVEGASTFYHAGSGEQTDTETVENILKGSGEFAGGTAVTAALGAAICAVAVVSYKLGKHKAFKKVKKAAK